MVEEQADRIRMRVQLHRAFTPGAPISRRELFAGRIPQMDRVMMAVSQDGQHAVIYGERGVGKTSLAGLIHEDRHSYCQALRRLLTSYVRVYYHNNRQLNKSKTV